MKATISVKKDCLDTPLTLSLEPVIAEQDACRARSFLSAGDRVKALKGLARRDGGAQMRPGDTGTIQHVHTSSKAQIVAVQPDGSELPIVDVVCMFDEPPVLWRLSDGA